MNNLLDAVISAKLAGNLRGPAEVTPAGIVAATGRMTADQKLQMQANLGYATENWVTDQLNSLTVLDEEVF